MRYRQFISSFDLPRPRPRRLRHAVSVHTPVQPFKRCGADEEDQRAEDEEEGALGGGEGGEERVGIPSVM